MKFNIVQPYLQTTLINLAFAVGKVFPQLKSCLAAAHQF